MQASDIDSLDYDTLDFLIETLVFRRKPWPDQEAFPLKLVPPRKAWSRNIDGVMPMEARHFTRTSLTLYNTIDTLNRLCDRLKLERLEDGLWHVVALVHNERLDSTDREICVAVSRQLLKVYLTNGHVQGLSETG